MTEPRVDIFLTTHNHVNLTLDCIEALYQYTDIPFLLTVIDDSTDSTPQELQRLIKEKGNIKVIRPKVEITSCFQCFNFALKETSLPYIVLMVNSVRVDEHWLEYALDLMEKRSDCGIVGFKILHPWGTIQCTSVMGVHKNGMMRAVAKDEPGHRGTYLSKVPAVGAAALLIRREAIKDGFDETTYIGFRGWDDLDLCLSMRAKKWDVIYCGYGAVYHIDSPTKKKTENFWEEYELNKEKFLEKWGYEF